jgi:hypothetical protein
LAKTRKMVNLAIEETSGVDHPAHLSEGWLVMKAANPSDVQRVLDETLNKEYLVKPEDKKKADEEMLPTDEMDKEMTIEVQTEDDEEETPMDKESAPEEETDEEKMARLRAMQKSDIPVEEFIKSAPQSVVKKFDELRKAADEAVLKAALVEAELKKEREERADVEAVEKAKSYTTHLSIDPATVGPALRRLATIDTELAKSLEEVLTSVNAQAESANIFAEIGKPTEFNGDGAFSKMTAMAKSAVESGVAKTVEQALADIAIANPDLYKQYLTEKGA